MYKYYLILLAALIMVGCNENNSIQQEENRQYKIAFTYFDGSVEVLATVNRDGNNLKDIHNLTSTSFITRWSPDGSKLAFDVYFSVNIGVVNRDGSGFKILSNAPSGFYEGYSWFEDSRRIAFARKDSIYSIDVITDEEKFIATGEYPEVSPSGNKIAFLRNSSLYIMNENGTSEFHLADSVRERFRWSPNVDKIAFVDYDGALCLIDLNGNGKIKLTPDGSVGQTISWSPNGSRLVYEQVYGIGVVNADGTGNNLIAINAWSPDWSNDGLNIIYNSTASGLIMVKPDGTDSVQVVPLKPSFNIAWSPIPLADIGSYE